MKFYFKHAESDDEWSEEFDDYNDAYDAYPGETMVDIMTEDEYELWRNQK